MGFFSKIFKGVKKVFKKIGKGIKGVFKGIGKFMNKIGIAGQIALMFVPGIGPMLSGMLKGLGGVAATALGSMGTVGNAILSGAKFVIGKASAFAGGVKNTFRTITQGVKTFAGEFTKTALNKMGFDPTKFGWSADGSFDTWVKSGKDQTFGDAWSKVTTNITDNASKILDPFRKSVVADSGATLDTLSDSTFKPIDEIKQLNPQIQNWDDISGKAINLDPDNVSQVFGVSPLKSTATMTQPQTPSLLDPDTNLLTGEKIVPKPTVEVPFKLPESAVDTIGTDTSGGSLLGMPSVGDAAGQVALEVAKTAAVDAYMGEPPAMGYGQLVDVGQPQVYGASQQQNFIQAAADPYMGYRDPQGSYGYGVGDSNIYYNHMARLGLT